MARGVISGVVTDRHSGFFNAGPGLMLEIEVKEAPKFNAVATENLAGANAAGLTQTVFAFYPAGNVQVGPVELCVTAAGWPQPPEIGAEILLMPQLGAVTDSPQIFVIMAAGGSEVLFEDSLGLRGPRTIERFPDLRGMPDMASIRSAARALISGGVQ